jgi:hypothetical protein
MVLVLALVVMAASTAVGACGLPQDSQARPVASADVPPGLLGPTTTIETTTSELGPRFTLYFLDTNGTRLVGVPRNLADLAPSTLLSAVIRGPNKVGENLPLRSDIPPSTEVIELTREEDTLTVVLSDDITKVTGSAQANAFAQLVWTATDIPGVRHVRFFRSDADGNREIVRPLTDFGSDMDLLGRGDYQKIKPAEEPVPTTVAGAAPP